MAISSGSVFVFPCATRRGIDNAIDARLLSEANITNIIKSITDNDSYVISFKDNKITFVLYGYYFEVNLAGILPDTKSSIYVKLKMKDSPSDLIESDDADQNGASVFKGLDISTVGDDYDLQLLEVVDSEYSVPPSSLVKFNSSSVTIDSLPTLDCGVLSSTNTQ